ncbi:MAG: hypothetical protein KDD48_01345 [Bdellovibrionales bacterium]|nr:hypothetical protein [Bdellovibrionales bacterium]
MNKNHISTIVLLLTLSFLFVGCGGVKKAADTKKTGDEDQAQTTDDKDKTPPSTPKDIKVTQAKNESGTLVGIVSWTASTDDKSKPETIEYYLYELKNADDEIDISKDRHIKVKGAPKVNIDLKNHGNGDVIYLKIMSRDEAGNLSSFSEPFKLTITTDETSDEEAPTAPSDLSIDTTTRKLTWTKSSDNITPEAEVTYYVFLIEDPATLPTTYDIGDAKAKVVGKTEHIFAESDLRDAKGIVIIAVDKAGNGSKPSSLLNIVPASS